MIEAAMAEAKAWLAEHVGDEEQQRRAAQTVINQLSSELAEVTRTHAVKVAIGGRR